MDTSEEMQQSKKERKRYISKIISFATMAGFNAVLPKVLKSKVIKKDTAKPEKAAETNEKKAPTNEKADKKQITARAAISQKKEPPSKKKPVESVRNKL